jgi:hypothetical protein
MDWMQILAAVAAVMMLFVLWPAYKHWSANSPKAEAGDWQAALLPLAAVVGLVILLIMAVR